MYLCFLYDSHYKYQLFPKTTVTGLVLVIDTDCVLCEVWTEYWHVIWIYWSSEMANTRFARRFYQSPFIKIFTSRKHARHLLRSLNNMFYHVSNIYKWWQTMKLSEYPVLTNDKHFLPETDNVWTPLQYSLWKPLMQMPGIYKECNVVTWGLFDHASSSWNKVKCQHDATR